MQPRVPFRSSLRRIKVVLGVVDPALSTGYLLSRIHVFIISVAQLVRAYMPAHLRIANVSVRQLCAYMSPFLRAYDALSRSSSLFQMEPVLANKESQCGGRRTHVICLNHSLKPAARICRKVRANDIFHLPLRCGTINEVIAKIVLSKLEEYSGSKSRLHGNETPILSAKSVHSQQSTYVHFLAQVDKVACGGPAPAIEWMDASCYERVKRKREATEDMRREMQYDMSGMQGVRYCMLLEW